MLRIASGLSTGAHSGPTCRVECSPPATAAPFPSPHRKTKQAENAGKSATQKKAEQKANKAAKNEKKSFG